MTLVATSDLSCTNQLPSSAPCNCSSDEESESDCSGDDSMCVQQLQSDSKCNEDCLMQSLGYPNSNIFPSYGEVSIENSNDVHIGNKNFYNGPVKIKQIVYANGNPALVNSSDKAKDNLGFEMDSGHSAAEVKDCCKDPELADQAAAESPQSPIRNGFIWLQNVSKHRSVEIGIFVIVVILFFIVLMVLLVLGRSPAVVSNPSNDLTTSSQKDTNLRMVSRYEWVAQPPIKKTTTLQTPVPYVIIHHTATEFCTSQAQCVFHVRQIQTFHIESRGWFDIAYNFLVGGDGAAYEGRGWTGEGAHTLYWNKNSIGIAFVGTFLTTAPPEIQILACQKLIDLGVKLGYIQQNYTLLGARQLFATESPGLALFEIIKKWDHWHSL
uniref:Peptidoglycan recognition protein family domain-containing protein n=1 Tax=Dendroctonus ponderosae TaxID=77166 RepID=A0AAR5PRB0_DENPD